MYRRLSSVVLVTGLLLLSAVGCRVNSSTGQVAVDQSPVVISTILAETPSGGVASGGVEQQVITVSHEVALADADASGGEKPIAPTLARNDTSAEIAAQNSDDKKPAAPTPVLADASVMELARTPDGGELATPKPAEPNLPGPVAIPDQANADSEMAPGTVTTSFPSADGEDAGRELTLADIIEVTLNASPDLVSASEQIDRAEAILERARAEFYPTLGISETYGVSDNPTQAFMFMLNQGQLDPTLDFNHPGTRDDFHTELMFHHSIYTGGRREHELCAAAAGRESAMHNLAAVQNQLVFKAAESYYRLVQADVLVGVREEAVRQVEHHLKIVESRYRNETAVKSDVLTVEVRLAEVREALISARNQLELAWSVLENVTGSSVPRRSLPEHVMAAPWGEDIDRVEGVIAEAQSLRPEVGALAGRRRAAAEQACAAESGKRPAAEALASYDLFTGDLQRGNESYFVGIVLSLNLFDGGRTKMDVATATARVRELRAMERRLLLDIELDVRKSHLALADSRQRLEVATQAIVYAEESLREIEVRYRGQASTISELVDSQVALSNARVRRANSAAQVEIARASLQRAIGRLTDSMLQ